MMSLDADTMTIVRVLRVGKSCCGLPACHFTKNHVNIDKQLQLSVIRRAAINNTNM